MARFAELLGKGISKDDAAKQIVESREVNVALLRHSKAQELCDKLNADYVVDWDTMTGRECQKMLSAKQAATIERVAAAGLPVGVVEFDANGLAQVRDIKRGPAKGTQHELRAMPTPEYWTTVKPTDSENLIYTTLVKFGVEAETRITEKLIVSVVNSLRKAQGKQPITGNVNLKEKCPNFPIVKVDMSGLTDQTVNNVFKREQDTQDNIANGNMTTGDFSPAAAV
jgi:hypothetical protein